MRSLGYELHDDLPEEWRWCGRRVKVVHGTTVSMPDTAANQREYPQSPSQKPGLGFPITRMVVVFCLATGAVLEAALGKYQGKQTGENALFRRTWEGLSGRRRVAGGSLLRLVHRHGAVEEPGAWTACVGCTSSGSHDFRRGRRLGKEDHIVSWAKPDRPDWMDEATYESLPGEMEVRGVRVHVAARGFRTRVLDLVTTLLDADIYRKKDLADLYRRCWEAELHLRSIKAVLELDVLRCKTPEMVCKEIGMGLLVYNVIRAVMVAGWKAHGQRPHRVSFKGALQTLLGVRGGCCGRKCLNNGDALWRVLLVLDRRRRGGASPGPSRAAGGETSAQALSAVDGPPTPRPKPLCSKRVRATGTCHSGLTPDGQSEGPRFLPGLCPGPQGP